MSLSAAAVFARGSGMGMGMGMGMHHHAVTGGAAGTSPSAPGTNSLGTALSLSGKGSPMAGAELGTDPALKREDAKVARMIKSRGACCSALTPSWTFPLALACGTSTIAGIKGMESPSNRRSG
jgi:hypothetical protein